MIAGGMMHFPLTLSHFLTRAKTFFADSEIVSRQGDGGLHRYTYLAMYRRACQVAGALRRLGVQPGDRVATLAWNHHRHLELYFAVPASGAVLHTLNLRLHADELAYIAAHAEDTVLFVDRSLLPLWHAAAARVPSVKHVVVIDDGPEGGVEAGGEQIDTTAYLDYETLLAGEADSFDFPVLDENAAAGLCYTSGTTGHPKGVLYSHRSTVLHTLVLCMADVMGIGEADSVLPAVPMFHANAWGLPFACVCTGAKIVLPGRRLDAVGVLELISGEGVTVAAGVPTIWLGALALLDSQLLEPTPPYQVSTLRLLMLGGSAVPASLIDGFESRHGVHVMQLWGMTETNPMGSIARPKGPLHRADRATQLAIRTTQGYVVPCLEQRHVDASGQALPWDGQTMGELEVRGAWVAGSYYRGRGEPEGADRFSADGWLKTADVVTIDAAGYLRICDRSKDVIKSGGEWISSVALENALMSHPAVLEAAVFAGQHPTWMERPIAAVVFKPGRTASDDALRAHLMPVFPRFWLPDVFIHLAQIPRTSTGKFQKLRLRQDFGTLLLQPLPHP